MITFIGIEHNNFIIGNFVLTEKTKFSMQELDEFINDSVVLYRKTKSDRIAEFVYLYSLVDYDHRTWLVSQNNKPFVPV